MYFDAREFISEIAIGDVLISQPTILRFSPDGKVVGVGCTNGVGIVDVETSKYFNSAVIDSNFSNITAIYWYYNQLHLKDFSYQSVHDVMNVGGINLVQRIGNFEYYESSLNEKKLNYRATSTLFKQLSLIMFTYNAKFVLTCYVQGLFPIFSVNLLVMSNAHTLSHALSLQINENSFIGCFSLHNNIASSRSISSPYISDSCLRHYHHISQILVRVDECLSKCSEMVALWSKKWKDAIKIVQLKMSLIQSATDAYNLNYNPAEFLFSISQFGLWHPAAISCQSHWNEQGLNRLSAVTDATLLLIIRQLQLFAIPLANNLNLDLRFSTF